MKTIAIALSLVLLCAAGPAECAAEKPQPASFDTLLKAAKADGLDENTRRDRWQKVADLAEPGPSARLAYALVHLADAYTGKDNEKSVAMYKRAIELRQQAHKTETLGMVRNLLRYGMMQQAVDVHKDIDAHEKGEAAAEKIDVRPTLSRALEIAQKIDAPIAFQFQIMQCLSSAYYIEKQYDEAEKLDLKMIEFAADPDTALARSELMAGYGNLLLIYSAKHRDADMEEVSTKLTTASDATPSAEQIKALQNEYVTAENRADESEEREFKTKGPGSSA